MGLRLAAPRSAALDASKFSPNGWVLRGDISAPTLAGPKSGLPENILSFFFASCFASFFAFLFLFFSISF